MTKAKLIKTALEVLKQLGFPRAQLNERSALCLLALLNLTPGKEWSDSAASVIGITPVMDWIAEYYRIKYAPNTRETFRRQTMHQFIEAAIVVANPDDPSRSVNSPKNVYQVNVIALSLFQAFGGEQWAPMLEGFQRGQLGLKAKYAKERDILRVPIMMGSGIEVFLSVGEHSNLIRDIVEKFGPTFLKDGVLVYVGDTGDKHAIFEKDMLAGLGVVVDMHGKMPDVILFDRAKSWLFLIESVTSHGPVDGKRFGELSTLFAGAKVGLVFVTAFPTRNLMMKYLPLIAWETEVWVAEAPTHLIHFNGDRFLGPYA